MSFSPRQLVAGIIVVALVSQAAVVGIGGTAAQTIPTGTPTPSGDGNESGTTNLGDQSTPLDAPNQRNQTSPGNVRRGLTGGNVSESINRNASQSGSGGSGGGGLFGFNMTQDVIHPTLNTTKQGLKGGMMFALNHSMEVTVGTPVPEDEDNNGIVFIPTNDGWSNMYHQYFIPYIFPLALVLALASMIAKCGMMPWRALRNPTYSQSQAFVGFVLTLFAIAFTVPIISLMHTFIDVLATNVAPSPKELTQSTEGMMNLGSGAIFAVLGAVVIGFTEALGLAFIYALRYGALFVIPWFLPLLVALAYNAPHKRLSGFASEMIWQYIGLLIQAFPVALLLRAAYTLQWDFGYGGFIGMLASGSIFLAAIGLPILTSIGMFKAAPSVQSVASGAAGYMVGSQASNYARQAPGQAARGGYSMMGSARDTASEKFTQVKEAIREYRESGGESDPSREGIPDSGQL